MKKKGFLIGMVLSLAVCLCLALLCACSETGTNAGETSKQREVYNAYVAYATAAGDDVLSYEEWLESIRGKDGVDGKDGKDGIDGKDGLDGQNGKDGTNGQDGKSAYDIWKENGHSGSEAEFLEWLKGEKGETGEQGAQGQKGDDGADGQDGKDGQNGTNGQDGKSAYDIWKENGHSGTEAEFLEWLKGEKGDTGTAGAQGQKGDNGADGLSAFDLFKKYYPYYQGTEKDWIDDLMYDNLTVFTITFKSEVAEDILRYAFIGQDLLDIPEVPEKEGQASAKWDREDFTNITSDIEVHAVYTMKELTVTFHNEYTEEEDVTRTVQYGQAVEDVPTIKEKTDQLAYWDVKDFSRITENMTVNAVYETEGLAFTLINNQQEYRVSAGTMSKETEELFIPAVHDEKPVTVIAENAFEALNPSYRFKLAHLPESITEIRASAFESCGLQSINIPSGVTKIAPYTFRDCGSLTAVEMPSVTTIDEQAFNRCSHLTTVKMPNVTTIESQAFRECTNLITLEMPNVTTIESQAFGWCSNLLSVEMSQVTSIGNYAFSSCTSLEHIEIPSGVSKLDYCLFDGCTSLKYVILPSGITSIEVDIFKGCTVFEAIYFKGDANTWAALEKSWAGEVFNDAKVYYYADPMPEENEGDYWHYDADDKMPVVWKKQS